MQVSHSSSIYDDALIYDAIHDQRRGTEDAQFFLKLLAQAKGPVLELACGTGRVTIPIAERGYEITGIDIEPVMLNRAREKSAEKGLNVNWVLGDVEDFHLGKKFGFIVYPLNSITHLLYNESVEGCFACVREHLADDGLFTLQMYNPGFEFLMRDPNQRYPVMEFEDPNGRGQVVLTENNIYDRASQINCANWYFKWMDTGEEIAKDLHMRVFYPQELDALIHHCGLEIIHKYGGYDGSAFTSDSPLQIPVCRKATS